MVRSVAAADDDVVVVARRDQRGGMVGDAGVALLFSRGAPGRDRSPPRRSGFSSPPGCPPRRCNRPARCRFHKQPAGRAACRGWGFRAWAGTVLFGSLLIASITSPTVCAGDVHVEVDAVGAGDDEVGSGRVRDPSSWSCPQPPGPAPSKRSRWHWRSGRRRNRRRPRCSSASGPRWRPWSRRVGSRRSGSARSCRRLPWNCRPRPAKSEIHSNSRFSGRPSRLA